MWRITETANDIFTLYKHYAATRPNKFIRGSSDPINFRNFLETNRRRMVSIMASLPDRYKGKNKVTGNELQLNRKPVENLYFYSSR